jgi:peptidoglycan pentaglycine glycine transferase (the first glycine)
MKLKSLTSVEFDEFAKTFENSNFYQTSNYALLMGEHGYDFEYVGLFDENDNIVAGSMILFKKIRGRISYGYAPNGFLMDYSDSNLVKEFSNEIKSYYADKNVAFIKVNPLIVTGILDGKQKEFVKTDGIYYKDDLVNNRYLKLKNNMYFESSLPRFDAFVDLKNSNFESFKKNTRNKIRKSIKRGLVFEKARMKDFDYLLGMFPKDSKLDSYFYKDMYNIFDKNESIDVFLVKVDYEEYLINSRIAYDKEIERNTKLNEMLIKYPTENVISEKMNSDRIVLSYKNDILEGTKGLKDDKDNFVAGAIVVRYKNTAYIVSSWYDTNLAKFDANYFLHYNLIEYYKDDFDFLGLNGITGDLSNSNRYKGLNDFKLGFNPIAVEYIGEFDLIINYNEYVNLQENNLLAMEFNKKA